MKSHKVDNIYPNFKAVVSKDKDNVMLSSSGGVFFELCKTIINKGGIVYGAISTDVTLVEHMRASTLEEAALFRKSKYLRSKIGGCYQQVKKDLEEGKLVLFSGVGCQIAGLYRFLGAEYENLITCDVVCHGAPMSDILKQYVVAEETKHNDKIIEIVFRDKRNGWKNNSICEKYQNGNEHVMLSNEHPVHSLYVRGINMEEGCGSCNYQRLPRIADISLADFWQYNGRLLEENEESGISLVAINTLKGEQLFNVCETHIEQEDVTAENALLSCRHMSNSPRLHNSHKAFKHFLNTTSFEFAMKICKSFGDIILPEELCQIEEIDEQFIKETLWNDTHEVIYVCDELKRLKGIITFGAFAKGYALNQEWINYHSSKVTFSENCIEELKKIFDGNQKINRVPVVDKAGRICFEVRRGDFANGKKDMRKLMLPFAELARQDIPCIYVNRPGILESYTYSQSEQRRMQNKSTFPVLRENILGNEEDLREIFKDKYTEDYINALCKIPSIVEKNNRFVHLDQASQFVNVVAGMRVTVGQPSSYACSVHIYGRCGVFGYAVEDVDSMPSQLQRLFIQHGQKVKVVNHGLWGADDRKILENLRRDIDEGVIEKGDIVVVYMAELPFMSQLKEMKVQTFDSTIAYHEILKQGATFYDRPGHMTADGYRFMAGYIYDKLAVYEEKYDAPLKSAQMKKEHCCTKQEILDVPFRAELMEYIKDIKLKLPWFGEEAIRVGAIIMNCNPFTKGHQYLIETARQSVDYLLIFVLEEDKSIFAFSDRINMVKAGTKKMENVYVFPSGKFMISTLTFPEYFLKEQQPKAAISPVLDVELFGKYIAPELGISVRFVGTEPIDHVTAQYNQTLKKILPQFGVELREIERLENSKGYISATKVRKCLEENNLEGLSELVPATTYEYLKGMVRGK